MYYSARDITKPKGINEADMIHMCTLSYPKLWVTGLKMVSNQ
jgi:hypothetical protein